jgi:hypothetical protein
VRALESPSQAERRATTWYDASQLRVRLSFTNAYSGTLHLYAIDWDSTVRRETVSVDDGSGPRLLSLSTSFGSGAWLHFPIAVSSGGSILITITNNAGTSSNGVLSGVFLGGGSATPTVPGAPTGLTATPGNAQVALSWTAPASDGGSAITGYTATASPGGATCSTVGTTSCAVSGLINGTAYSFTVAATNAIGAGPASSSVSATPRTVPGAPTAVTAASGNAQLTISWTAPASNGGSSITGYTATASPGGANCATAGALSCVIGGLTNGTSYSVFVVAMNAAGTGPASAPASGTPKAVPGAPTGIVATPGNGQLAMSWTAPASDGGSPITGYTATATPGGATCSTGGTTSCTVTGLTNGTGYWVVVTAANAAGTGPGSTPVSGTPRTVPGAPMGLIATPGNAQVALSWTAPVSNGGSPITGDAATASPGGATCGTTGTTSCTITGLTNGTTYTFTVQATNVAGTGAASSPTTATPRTVPGAPQGVSAAPDKAKGIDLAWTAPASNGGASITGYRIYRGTTIGGLVFLTSVGNVLTYRDIGTSKNVRYYYEVSAVNAAGEGARSSQVTAIAK